MSPAAPWMFSGSEAERALACPASTLLPQIDRDVGDAAVRGTAVHAYLELCADVGPDKALKVIETHPEFGKWLEVCEAIVVSLLPTQLAAEVSFAFNFVTGRARELGRSLDRKYIEAGLDPRVEVPITVDVLGVDDDSVLVADYKTGRTKVTAARRNKQLALGAVCAADVYGKDRATVEIVHPARDGAPPYRDRAELDGFDLDDMRLELKTFYERREETKAWMKHGNSPSLAVLDVMREGNHCRYCRCYTVCPAKTALAVRMGTGDEIQELSVQLTPENAGQIYVRAKMAKDFLQRIFDAIYGMAEQDPIEFAPGQMLGLRDKKGNEKLSGPVVHEVVKLLHSDEIADDAVELSATKTGIQRALRGRVKPLGKSVERVLELVRKHGGATRAVSRKVVEYEKDG